MSSTSLEHGNWTEAGSDTAAQNSYASVRKALADIEKRRNVEIFLQGSYANSTNIRADSDVDIVVMTKWTFQGAIDRLGPQRKAEYAALGASDYQITDLRQEVTDALTAYYGSNRVHPRNKCIKVDKAPGYVDADVVPAVQYRWYTSPNADLSRDFVEGISIAPARGGRIINFPKEHITNGQNKNAVCSGRYKQTVRQVKRLRNRAVDEGRLMHDDAPGYLLECMVYNVPTERFSGSNSGRLQDVVLWLRHASKSDFLSCDRIHTLFGTDPGNFDVDKAQRVIDALWDAY